MNENASHVVTVIGAPTGHSRGQSLHNTEIKLQRHNDQMSSRSNLRPYTAAEGHKSAGPRGLRYSTAASIPHL